jgi:hypothetical protein
VDPVPDPLLLRKSGSAVIRSRDLLSVARNSDHRPPSGGKTGLLYICAFNSMKVFYLPVHIVGKSSLATKGVFFCSVIASDKTNEMMLVACYQVFPRYVYTYSRLLSELARASFAYICQRHLWQSTTLQLGVQRS